MMYLILITLTKGMQWCHWWCCWPHIMWMPAPMVSLNHHVAPHFSCHGLRIAMVPLRTLLASCDTNTSANGVSGQKVMSHLFQLHWPEECNGTIDDSIGITWHWWQHQWHHMTKKWCCTLFQLFWSKECSGDNMMLFAWCDTDARANGIKWPKCHVASHFDWLDLGNTMVPLTNCQVHMMPGWVPMVSHDQKSHVAHHFVHLNLRNAMTSLIVMSTSHDADTYAKASHDTNINATSIL